MFVYESINTTHKNKRRLKPFGSSNGHYLFATHIARTSQHQMSGIRYHQILINTFILLYHIYYDTVGFNMMSVVAQLDRAFNSIDLGSRPNDTHHTKPYGVFIY